MLSKISHACQTLDSIITVVKQISDSGPHVVPIAKEEAIIRPSDITLSPEKQKVFVKITASLT